MSNMAFAESHRDLRSTSKSYKRDKDSSSKWSMGLRPGGGCRTNLNGEQTSGTPEQFAKVRPQKRWSEMQAPSKDHSNVAVKGGSRHGGDYLGSATGRTYRTSRKTDALVQAAEGSLSKSLLELLPEGKDGGSGADGVVYSFDAESSPKLAVGLDKLIEGAEERYRSKETDKLVRMEYEILDVAGETVKIGKRSPKTKAVQKGGALEDDDYELV